MMVIIEVTGVVMSKCAGEMVLRYIRVVKIEMCGVVIVEACRGVRIRVCGGGDKGIKGWQ